MAQNWKLKDLTEKDAALAVALTIPAVLRSSRMSEKTARRIGEIAIQRGYKASWSPSQHWEVQLPLDFPVMEEPTP